MSQNQKLIINFEEFETLMKEYHAVVEKVKAFKFKFYNDKDVPISLEPHFETNESENPS